MFEVPTAGVPARLAVPSPLSTNVTPVGSGPVSVNEGTGNPSVVTRKEPGVCSVKVVPLPEVMAGPRLIAKVKFCVALVPTPLAATKVIG